MYGMTASETAVMDLFDQGYRAPAIAERTGQSEAMVQRIIDRLHVDVEALDQRYRQQMRDSSRALVMAIKALQREMLLHVTTPAMREAA